MPWLASIFVGKPLNIAVVAAVFLAGYAGLRVSAGGAFEQSRRINAR